MLFFLLSSFTVECPRWDGGTRKNGTAGCTIGEMVQCTHMCPHAETVELKITDELLLVDSNCQKELLAGSQQQKWGAAYGGGVRAEAFTGQFWINKEKKCFSMSLYDSNSASPPDLLLGFINCAPGVESDVNLKNNIEELFFLLDKWLVFFFFFFCTVLTLFHTFFFSITWISSRARIVLGCIPLMSASDPKGAAVSKIFLHYSKCQMRIGDCIFF